MSNRKKAPPGLKNQKPKCPPHTKNTLQCLIDGGEIYCGQGKTWIEKPGSDGTLGKCVSNKTLQQNKARDERRRRRSAANNMTNNKKKNKLKF